MSALPGTPIHAHGGDHCRICYPDGAARRDAGMALAEAGAGVIAQQARDDWNARADKHFAWWVSTQTGTFLLDEYRALPQVPEPPSAAMWGPMVKRAMKAGVIHAVGVTTATTASRHAGIARVYKAGSGQ